jgi:bidirectional [NiFe] hydrogenase diaphorase subunit
MSVITLRVNDQDVAVPAGSSLLTATRAAGVDLPTLCHLEGLTPVSACRLFLVEVEGSGKLLTACSTEASEGMVVQTDTATLRDYRRMAVELFFAEGNHICAFCVANGHCELQNLAVAVGMDHSRFPYQYPHRQVDASHALFAIDHHHCVLCTRCVRVCDEIEGAHVWDVAFRGAAARVITDLNQPWGKSDSCTSCGKCVKVCPTGALFEKIQPAAGQVKHREFLTYIKTAREKKQWIR